MNSNELTDLFFSELKKYNSTNFRTLRDANLSEPNPHIYKCCSSVVTRYFIFAENHPEITEAELKLLYYKLRLDLIAFYFSEYPSAEIGNLTCFQQELRDYIERSKSEVASC